MALWPFNKKKQEPAPIPPAPAPVDPEILLEREKANFAAKFDKFDESLAENKSDLDKLEKAYNDLLIEHADLTVQIPALMAAHSMVSAKKKAVRLEYVKQELPNTKAAMKSARESYNKLLVSRNIAKSKADEQIAALTRSIAELKSARSLADINAIANNISSSVENSNLRDIAAAVEEAKIAARVRARVNGDSIL